MRLQSSRKLISPFRLYLFFTISMISFSTTSFAGLSGCCLLRSLSFKSCVATTPNIPTPPSHLIGYQDRFQTPSRIDIINVLKWNPPVEGWTPVSYKIFRDPALTDLIHTVPGDAPHKYFDHNRHSHTNYTYYVVSVSSTGALSDPVSLTIPSRF